jgi:hypothetical protein
MSVLESTVQPVICCLGQNVAGCPTQFILERGFEAKKLQWRALTVEIALDKLPLVNQAMLAMNFRGVRFYGELAQAAVGDLGGQQPECQFIGSATSARWSNGQWEIWDNLGPAWLQLASEIAGSNSPCVFWLHGDSRLTRSLFIALASGSLNHRWIWSAAPSTTEFSSLSETVRNTAQPHLVQGNNQPSSADLAHLLGMPAVNKQPPDSSPLTLVLATEAQQWPPELVIQPPETELKLVVPVELSLPPQWPEVSAHRVSAAEVAVAAEVYDFQRWTETTVDSGVIRDAYDEYCDF